MRVPTAKGIAGGVRVLGGDTIQRNLNAVARDLVQQQKPAEMAAGEPIKEKWKGLVPELEGHYRDSLAVAWTPQGAAVGTSWLGGVPRNEQPFLYSKRLEFGLSGMRAQPSARPAAEAARAEAKAAAAREFNTVVRKRRARSLPGLA